MVATTSQQTLQIDPLVAGVEYLMVITNATVASTLQFKHLGDPVTRNHPDHTAVAASPVIIKKFLCPAPLMALYFETPPASDYHVTIVPVTTPEF